MLAWLCPCFRHRQRHGYDAVPPSSSSFTHAVPSPSATVASPYQSAPRGGGAAVASSSTADSSAAVAVLPAITLPRYITDEEAERCFGCATAFDTWNRRHHCRRCRNIFCATCTSRERPVLLYMLTDPVRVCLRCSNELGKENQFIDLYLSSLVKGLEVTMSKGVMALGKRVPVSITLATDLEALHVVDTNNRGGAVLKRLPLEDIGGVSEEGKLGLLLLMASGTRLKFDTVGPGQRQTWISAIREATKVVPAMKGLRGRVEEERTHRAVQERMALADKAEKARKREKAALRNSIADKYGLARR